MHTPLLLTLLSLLSLTLAAPWRIWNSNLDPVPTLRPSWPDHAFQTAYPTGFPTAFPTGTAPYTRHHPTATNAPSHRPHRQHAERDASNMEADIEKRRFHHASGSPLDLPYPTQGYYPHPTGAPYTHPRPTGASRVYSGDFARPTAWRDGKGWRWPRIGQA